MLWYGTALSLRRWTRIIADALGGDRPWRLSGSESRCRGRHACVHVIPRRYPALAGIPLEWDGRPVRDDADSFAVIARIALPADLFASDTAATG